jgi:hypothetical protein
MKKLFFILSVLMSTSVLYSQNCYSVSKLENLTENSDLSSKKFVFGLKQLTEELMGEKYSICEDGLPVNVAITSIESKYDCESYCCKRRCRIFR